MKAIVLGMGLQGKAVIHDLESSGLIEDVFAADLFPTEKSRTAAENYIAAMGYSKTKTIRLDVLNQKDLPLVFTQRGIATKR